MATEVDSSTATGIPNPALGKPLPPYALAWGPSVCRPAFLPNTYDNRIAPEYIFLISDTDTETDATPNTGRYVVIERCDGCRDVRQACTRTLPACSRCVASKRECIVSQKIYVALPNPKVPHTRKANLSSVGVVRGEAVERSARHDRAGNETSVANLSRRLRPRRPISYYPDPGDSAHNVDPIPFQSTQERSCALKADLSKRRKGANKQKGTREQRRLLPKTAVRKIRSKIKKAGIKPRWPSERQTGKKRRVISGRKVSAKPTFAPTPQTGVVWLPISPTPNSPTPNEALRSPQQPLPGRPRIWTSSKHDLRQILPNLAREVNGLVFGCVDTPILFLEGPAWPADSWDHANVIKLSMVRQLVQSAEVDEAPKSAEAVYSIPPVNLDDVEPQRVCQPTHLHPSFQIDIAMPGSISAFHSYSSAYGPSIDAPGGLDGIALYRISPAPDSGEETAAGTVSHAVYKHPRQSQSPSTVSHPVSTTHTWISPINVRKAVAGPHPPDIHDASSLSCSTNLSNTVPRDVTVQPQHIHQSQALSEGQSKLFLRHNYYEGYGPELGSTEHVSSQSRCDIVLPLSANNFPFQDLRAPTTAAFSQIEADAAMHNPSVLLVNSDADLNIDGGLDNSPLSSTSLRRTQSHYEQAALDVHVSLPLEKMNDVDGLPEESQIARQRSSSPSEAGESPSIPLRCITSRTTTTAEDTASLALPLAGSSGLGNDQGQSSVQPDEVLDTTSYVPGWWPEEIKALVNNQTLQIPIRVILCRDSPLFPLSLPPEYGCVFLGFFYIKEVSMVVIGDKEPTPTSAAASLDHCREIGDRMCWDFKLEWTPGGEFVYPSMDIPLVPWWAVAQEATPYTHPQGDIPPFTLLPLHLLAANVASDFQFENGTSEVSACKAWHCTCCGKLNLLHNMRLQRCDHCQTANHLPPVAVDYVRGHRTTAPTNWPWDRPTKGINSNSQGSTDGSLAFSFDFGDGVMANHLFTCNAESLQEDPNRLFRDIQVDVELAWRAGQVMGSCYTYVAGSSFVGGHIACPWTEVPDCITKARLLMQNRCSALGNFVVSAINNLQIHAWMKPGSKKGCLLSVKDSAVIMLCLGADVELDIVPRSQYIDATQGADDPSRACVSAETLSDVTEEMAAPPDKDEVDMDISEDEVDEEGDRDMDNPHGVFGMLPKVTGKSVTRRIAKESLFITLVHGDILRLTGDDFECTLRRTGISMVLVGT